jgi:DNA-binding transcriptional LysR family regulator
MPLNLHLLRLFAMVAETGSFSRAAAVLRLSQPAISKGVRDFELQLGCRLLDRSHKGVKPTREGLALARHAKFIFASERSAEQELKSLRGLDSGSLRIGASTTIATYLLPEYLGEFHRAYPGIDLHLVSANTRDIADLMLQHEIEIALVEGPVDDEGLLSEPWQTDRMTIITGPSHPFGRKDQPIDPARLTKELLVIREPGSGSREVVNQLLSLHGIQPSRTMEIGSTEAIKQLVAAGLGISIVSVAAVKDQVNLQRLKMIEIAGIRLERTLWQLKVPGRMSIPAADVFEKLIKRNSGTEARSKSAHPAKTSAKIAMAAHRGRR